MAFPFVTIALGGLDSEQVFVESVRPLVNIHEMKKVGKYLMKYSS